jgi:ferric-dicitrate binding protein FerR (iron transport regulator)
MHGARLLLAAGLAGLLALPALAQPQNIGVAAAVKEQVTGSLGPQQRQLGRGDGVFQDEVIATTQTSSSQLLFLDETTLTVGPSSNVKLDEFVYDPRPGASKVTLTIGKGVTRFVTGVLQTNSYQIKTPTATIGVRGTILLIFVDESGVTSVAVEDGSAFITPIVNPSSTRVIAKGDEARVEVNGEIIGKISRNAARAFALGLTRMTQGSWTSESYATREEKSGQPLPDSTIANSLKDVARTKRCVPETTCFFNSRLSRNQCFTQLSSDCFID